MKKSIVLIVSSFFFLASCNSTKEPETPINPTNTYPSDGYVDNLPENISDGVFLHAFGWKYSDIVENLDAIKDAGYRAVQTLPVQQPKSKGVKWEYFYQPCSFSIATSSPLGTKDELKNLCEKANEKGISIIADIVFNHMATTGKENSNGTPEVDPEVETYEPYIYQNQTDTFHQVTTSTGSGATTQLYPGLPDLNTSNTYVQERAYSLLRECIDVGISGFRFDAAKHIETPNDPDHSSSFWDNTLEKAKTYYKNKTGKDLYAYGEILNNINEDGSGRKISLYTNYMKVTDNTYNTSIQSPILTKKNAADVVSASYGKKTDSSNLVNWDESHDQYLSTDSHFSNKKMARIWAVAASRKGVNSLYFSRMDENLTVGKISDYYFEDEHIAAVNRFHNRFVRAEEDPHAEQTSFYVNERYSSSDCGAIVIDLALKGSVSQLSLNHLEDGWYFDQMTSNPVKVENGKADITFEEGGVAILTKTKNSLRPSIKTDCYSSQYAKAFDVSLTVNNATSSSYSIDGKDSVSFTDTVKIRIGENANVGERTTLKVVATNGEFSIERTYIYTKIYLVPDKFNVINMNPEYLTESSLYIWAWPKGGNGSYNKDYTWDKEHQILLIDKASEYGGFLLVRYKKGYTITKLNEFDNTENFIAQTADINPNNGFYDASGF